MEALEWVEQQHWWLIRITVCAYCFLWDYMWRDWCHDRVIHYLIWSNLYSVSYRTLGLWRTKDTLIKHGQFKTSVLTAAIPSLHTPWARSKVDISTGIGSIATVAHWTRHGVSTAEEGSVRTNSKLLRRAEDEHGEVGGREQSKDDEEEERREGHECGVSWLLF